MPRWSKVQMSGMGHSIEIDDLLRHAGWLRALAIRLVGDSSRADDLTQETWAAALSGGPREASRLPAWLSSVTRRLAARMHRDGFRRRAREECAYELGGLVREAPVTPEALLERAELQQRIVTAVLALDEPYRATVLLRYYEDKSPYEIAALLAVPVATVRTRLARGHERLRERLDREYGGGRDAWALLVVPWCGTREATVGASASGSVAAAAGLATGSSISMITTIGSIGGAVMSKGVLVACVLVAAAGIAAGIALGRGPLATSIEVADEPAASVAKAEFERLAAERDELSEQLAAQRKQLAGLQEAKDRLDSEVVRLGDELAAAKQAASVAAVAVDAQGNPLPISFGEWGDLDALKNADWEKIASGIKGMSPLLAKLMKAIKEGKEPDPTIMADIQAENAKLLQYALSLGGKLPTNGAMINGEYTHPVSLANMTAALLDANEKPLTDEQRAAIAALGEEYDVDWKKTNEGYGEETSSLQKMIDELELKHEFNTRMRGVLDQDQLASFMDEEYRDANYLDPMSPSLMMAMKSQPVVAASAEAMREQLVSVTAAALGVESGAISASPAFDRWAADVGVLLEPVNAAESMFYNTQEQVAAGRAQLRAMEALASHPAVTPEARERLMKALLLVPRVVSQSAAQPPAPTGN